jgi:hypothetical protein
MASLLVQKRLRQRGLSGGGTPGPSLAAAKGDHLVQQAVEAAEHGDLLHLLGHLERL